MARTALHNRPRPIDQWLGLVILNTIKDLTSQLTVERLPLQIEVYEGKLVITHA
jgi:hypothetical protein